MALRTAPILTMALEALQDHLVQEDLEATLVPLGLSRLGSVMPTRQDPATPLIVATGVMG